MSTKACICEWRWGLIDWLEGRNIWICTDETQNDLHYSAIIHPRQRTTTIEHEWINARPPIMRHKRTSHKRRWQGGRDSQSIHTRHNLTVMHSDSKNHQHVLQDLHKDYLKWNRNSWRFHYLHCVEWKLLRPVKNSSQSNIQPHKHESVNAFKPTYVYFSSPIHNNHAALPSITANHALYCRLMVCMAQDNSQYATHTLSTTKHALKDREEDVER